MWRPRSKARKFLPDRQGDYFPVRNRVILQYMLVRTFDSSWNQINKQRRPTNKEELENTLLRKAGMNTLIWGEVCQMGAWPMEMLKKRWVGVDDEEVGKSGKGMDKGKRREKKGERKYGREERQ